MKAFAGSPSHGVFLPAVRRCTPCQQACVCSSTGLQTKDAGRNAQSIGRSLSDHSGSAVLRSDTASSGGAAAPSAGSNTSSSSGRAQSVRTASPCVEEEVLASHPGKRTRHWSKGIARSEATRRKISLAQKRRWKEKGTELRASIGEKNRGKTPWNKGQKMSDEIRANMSAGHRNKSHRVATKAKMSKSHVGMTHSEASISLMSAVKLGRPVNEDWRHAIAAGQRRRHAAIRVLSAVEGAHQQLAASTQDTQSVVSRLAHLRAADSGASSSGLKGINGSQPQTKAQILATYRSHLHEYRALQEELTPWTAAFTERHGRKPRLLDVERTGVEWLITRYKCYIMMRDRLIMNTPNLRNKLTGAKSGDAGASFDGDAGSWVSSANAVSANGAASGAARFAAALDHKRRQADAAVAPAALSANGPASTAGAADGTGGAPDAAREYHSPSPRARTIKAAPTSAPTRVRSAMAAALQYRQKRATDTVEAATAAATAAAAAPPPRRRSPAAPAAASAAPEKQASSDDVPWAVKLRAADGE